MSADRPLRRPANTESNATQVAHFSAPTSSHCWLGSFPLIMYGRCGFCACDEQHSNVSNFLYQSCCQQGSLHAMRGVKSKFAKLLTRHTCSGPLSQGHALCGTVYDIKTFVQVLTAACRHRQLTVTCCDQVLLDTSTSTGPQCKSDHYIFCIWRFDAHRVQT